MKKEQEDAMLAGFAQMIALLNLYTELSEDTSKVALTTKSKKRKNENLDELVLAQLSVTNLRAIISMLGPFLVSLGMNVSYDFETKRYSLVYKGNIIELSDDGKDVFLENMLEGAAKE